MTTLKQEARPGVLQVPRDFREYVTSLVLSDGADQWERANARACPIAQWLAYVDYGHQYSVGPWAYWSSRSNCYRPLPRWIRDFIQQYDSHPRRAILRVLAGEVCP